MNLGRMIRSVRAVDIYASEPAPTEAVLPVTTHLTSSTPPAATTAPEVVEKIVYVDRVVEVEKPVYVDRVVEVEKIVEVSAPSDSSTFFEDYIPTEWAAATEKAATRNN